MVNLTYSIEWSPTTTTSTMIRSYGPLVRTRNTITAVAYLSIRGTAKVSTIACHSHVHTPSHADNASAYTRLYRQRGKESTFLLCLSFPLPQFFFHSLSLSPSRFLRLFPSSQQTRSRVRETLGVYGQHPETGIPSTSITRETARAPYGSADREAGKSGCSELGAEGSRHA